MGERGCGKSCLIKRYCEDKFVSKYIGTIGVDYGVKPLSLGEFDVKVNLWDMAGAPEYLEVRNEFYKDAQVGRGRGGTVRLLTHWLKAAFEPVRRS